MGHRICLIVDNPLRDLDGLTLLAWHLAKLGHEAYLVPMYDQGFDVPALKPDLVLVNYVRPNNLDLLSQYREAGIKVGVLDTEGAPSQGAESLAQQMVEIECGKYIDLYCLWGKEQYKAFEKFNIAPAAHVMPTGCPRYDYCASPWRRLLENPAGLSGYILVNTNFPTVNPRFSTGSSDEIDNMVAAGLQRDSAEIYVADATRAKHGIVDLLKTLLGTFPEQLFVLRPHPFESEEGYSELFTHKNFQLHQEGTSLRWIESAKALLHLNCSTAVEAIMLGKEPLSPAWLDTPALHAEGPASVSFLADTLPQLQERISDILQGENVSVPDEIAQARKDIIRQVYWSMDGLGSERVAEAIMDCLKDDVGMDALPRASARGRTVASLRRLLGPGAVRKLRHLRGRREMTRQKVKGFGVAEVRERINKINAVSGHKSVLRIVCDDSFGRVYGRLSGKSVRVFSYSE